MKPKPSCAREGRANPKGIPFLYLATDTDTALAEVRPWVRALVSVAEFRLTHPVKTVNCTSDGYFGAGDDEEGVWAAINEAFAQPVNPSDDVADYVPTQVLAELFKVHGLDGIGYRSSVGKGQNIAIFDPTLAEPVSFMVFEVQSVSLTADKVGYP
ncbi:MAG: RES family NAD+ phosphorylase [Phycisphaerae bacterium]|nr:RES family NAD+ phosphorylase [Phycisphaerae bacterium]